jgi:hypothetical protein
MKSMKNNKMMAISLLCMLFISNVFAMKPWQQYLYYKDVYMAESTRKELAAIDNEDKFFAAYYKALQNCNENFCTAVYDNLKITVKNDEQKSVFSFYELP